MMAIYDAVAANYNSNIKKERSAGDYTNNPLRSAHRELYQQLLSMLSSFYEAQYIALKDNDKRAKLMSISLDSEVCIKTNRPHLAAWTHKSESTVYRLLQRLKKANIISTVFHGPANNFEVFFTRDMLLISDEDNHNFCPRASILQTSQNEIIRNSLRSFCTLSINTKNIKNEIIQEHHKVSNSSLTSKMNLKEQFYKNTESSEPEGPAKISSVSVPTPQINELSNICGSSQSKTPTEGVKNAFGVVVTTAQINELSKESESAKEKYAKRLQDDEDRENNRLNRYVSAFISYVVTELYRANGLQVYDGEVLNAKNVAGFYFKQPAKLSVRACDIEMERLKRRVDMVARRVKMGKWFPFVGPSWYVHPDNPSGFAKTEPWLVKDNKYRELKRFYRLRNTAEAKMEAALQNVYRTNSIAVYESGIDYLRKKAPSMIEPYKAHAMTYLELQTTNMQYNG